MIDEGNDGVGAVAWQTTNVNDAEGEKNCEETVWVHRRELVQSERVSGSEEIVHVS